MKELSRSETWVVQIEMGNGDWIDWKPNLTEEEAAGRILELKSERFSRDFRMIKRTVINEINS